MTGRGTIVGQVDIDRFARDGFVIVPDLFSRREMKRFTSAVDRAVSERNDSPPPMAERDCYDQMFTQHYNLWEASEAVRSFTFEPRLGQIASLLLEADVVRLYCDQSFYKDPGSSPTGPHQDYRLLCIKETRTLSAWIPLEGCTPDCGALGYLPGSHLFGGQTNLDLLLEPDLLSTSDLQTLLANPVYLDLPPGSVAFHHVLTFHLSTPNSSGRTRKAFTITYFADGSTRGTAWPHASVDRAKIAVGERIEGPATPILWPPPDTLPPPPPPNPDPPPGWPGYTESG